MIRRFVPTARRCESAVSRTSRRTFWGKAQEDGDTTQFQRKDIIVAGNKIFLDNPHWSINKYGEALALNPGCYNSLIKRAFGYYQIEIYDSAHDDVSKALQINPLNSEGHFIQGLVYAKQNEHTLALDSLYKSLDLTCPIDPRYESIQNIIKNIQRVIRGESVPDITQVVAQAPPQTAQFHQPPQPAQPQQTAAQSEAQPSESSEIDDQLPPFQDPEFLRTQQNISQKMYNMGDDKFKTKMQELSQIPELQEFQKKIMSGEKITQYDYYKLYNEPSGRFAAFANKLGQMQQHPDLQKFAQLAATGDWNVAFSALNEDPKAMEAYMHFFKDEE